MILGATHPGGVETPGGKGQSRDYRQKAFFHRPLRAFPSPLREPPACIVRTIGALRPTEDRVFHFPGGRDSLVSVDLFRLKGKIHMRAAIASLHHFPNHFRTHWGSCRFPDPFISYVPPGRTPPFAGTEPGYVHCKNLPQTHTARASVPFLAPRTPRGWALLVH